VEVNTSRGYHNINTLKIWKVRKIYYCFDDCHEDKDKDKDYEMQTEDGVCIVSRACHKHTILGLME